MAIAVPVRPPQSAYPRRALPLLGALIILFVVMPWAVRPLEAWFSASAVALIGQAAEIAVGIALALWVVALLRRQQRLSRCHALALEQATLADPLTGLGNERAFARDLDLTLNRSRRTREPVAVLVLDIGRPAAAGGRHGHAAGERTLNTLAAVLRSSVRFGTDMGYRVGEDEFAMVLAADRDAAESVWRRVEWNFRERSPQRAPLSAGLAAWDGRSAPHEVLDQARRALRTGRTPALAEQMA